MPFRKWLLLGLVLSCVHPVAAKGADAISSDLFVPVAAAIDRLTAEVARAADALEKIVDALTMDETEGSAFIPEGGNAAGADGLRSGGR